MPTRKPNLKDYKGETFGIDSEEIDQAMKSAKFSDIGWPFFVGSFAPDKKREVDELIEGHWEWYNWDMSLRDKPRFFNDCGENVDDVDFEQAPVVAKNATTEPQRTRAVDRLKGRRK